MLDIFKVLQKNNIKVSSLTSFFCSDVYEILCICERNDISFEELIKTIEYFNFSEIQLTDTEYILNTLEDYFSNK